jgi:hypothetical protein
MRSEEFNIYKLDVQTLRYNKTTLAVTNCKSGEQRHGWYITWCQNEYKINKSMTVLNYMFK